MLDKCIDRKVWILMKNDMEYFGTLSGFEESSMTMVLHDVKGKFDEL